MATTTVLGIETSCDECSVAVVRHHGADRPLEVLAVATHSQITLHQPYGGVVPEVASRNHLETFNEMLAQALRESGLGPSGIDAIAVTNRPGLVGALLVGVTAAKALAYAWQKPLVPVHHLEGHALSVFLDKHAPAEVPYPSLMAVVSGGHTNLYVAKSSPELWPLDVFKRSLIGRSLDDAAGEAFDKTAKVLGFPYPGGVWIDRGAKDGDPKAFDFPRALPKRDNFDFSFSGLKTSAALQIQKLRQSGELESRKSDLCASIQEAIVDALWTKIRRAAEHHRCASVILVGGVAANSRLRARIAEEWSKCGLAHAPFTPKPEFCTDNGAMIAAAGTFRFLQGQHLRPHSPEMLTLNALANPEF